MAFTYLKRVVNIVALMIRGILLLAPALLLCHMWPSLIEDLYSTPRTFGVLCEQMLAVVLTLVAYAGFFIRGIETLKLAIIGVLNLRVMDAHEDKRR